MKEARAVESLFSATAIDCSQVAGFAELRAALDSSAVVLRDSRVVCMEQILTIALRLPPKDLENARNLTRDVTTCIAEGADGIVEDDVHPVLLKASNDLLG